MLTCDMLLHYYKKCSYMYVWRYAVAYSYHLSTFARVYTDVLAMVANGTCKMDTYMLCAHLNPCTNDCDGIR